MSRTLAQRFLRSVDLISKRCCISMEWQVGMGLASLPVIVYTTVRVHHCGASVCGCECAHTQCPVAAALMTDSEVGVSGAQRVWLCADAVVPDPPCV